jgi:hypothetical protein
VILSVLIVFATACVFAGLLGLVLELLVPTNAPSAPEGKP